MNTQVLSWIKRVDAQHSEEAMLGSLKESKEFAMIRKSQSADHNMIKAHKYTILDH